MNYLDDFCIVSGTMGEGCRDQGTVIAILRRLGFHISFKKLRSPGTTVRFLGIDIDSKKLEMRLPEDKLRKLVTILEKVRSKRKVSRRELERLGGLLAHCSKVVRGGRTFCRRIYDAIASVREPHFMVRLNRGFREDLEWWRVFSASFNGRARILGKFAAHVATYSDASNFGYGAMHGADWVAGAFGEVADGRMSQVFPEHHLAPDRCCSNAHINLREMWAAFAAALRWGEQWGDCSVTMVTDSTTVMAALNTGRSGSPEIMHYVRRLFWLSVKHNFHFNSVYINTKHNIICDALSRLDDPGSTSRIAEADPSQKMCCRDKLNKFTLYGYRDGGPTEGETRFPGPVVCTEHKHHKGSADEAVPGIRGDLLRDSGTPPLPWDPGGTVCNLAGQDPKIQFSAKLLKRTEYLPEAEGRTTD